MNKEDIDFLISIQDLEQPDFDNACLERENNRLNKENKKLNNIISELEKWLNKQWNKPLAKIYVSDVVKRINELKEKE